MTIIIILFGSLLLVAGALILINPNTIFGFLQNNIENTVIHRIAFIVRLVVGGLLVTHSNVSRFPQGVFVLGLFFIVSGLFLAALGRKKFRNLMSWLLKNMRPIARIAGMIAIVFGGFLVYAFQ